LESYVERWAREQKEKAEKVVTADAGKTERGNGQKATKEKRGRKQTSVVEQSDHTGS
jgi:hypothetical protein